MRRLRTVDGAALDLNLQILYVYYYVPADAFILRTA